MSHKSANQLEDRWAFRGYASNFADSYLEEPPAVAEEAIKLGSTAKVARSGKSDRRYIVRACSFMEKNSMVAEGDAVILKSTEVM